MATHNYYRTIGYVAGADLTERQNHLVKLDSSSQVVLAGVGDDPIGVNVDNGESGEVVGVMTEHGSTIEIVASAAISAGADVAPAANGRIRTAVATDPIIGTAQTAAAADGDLVTVLYQPRARLAV